MGLNMAISFNALAANTESPGISNLVAVKTIRRPTYSTSFIPISGPRTCTPSENLRQAVVHALQVLQATDFNQITQVCNHLDIHGLMVDRTCTEHRGDFVMCETSSDPEKTKTPKLQETCEATLNGKMQTETGREISFSEMQRTLPERCAPEKRCGERCQPEKKMRRTMLQNCCQKLRCCKVVGPECRW